MSIANSLLRRVLSYGEFYFNDDTELVGHKGNEDIKPGNVMLPYVFDRSGTVMVNAKRYLWADEYGNFDTELFRWFLTTQCDGADFSNIYPDLYE